MIPHSHYVNSYIASYISFVQNFLPGMWLPLKKKCFGLMEGYGTLIVLRETVAACNTGKHSLCANKECLPVSYSVILCVQTKNVYQCHTCSSPSYNPNSTSGPSGPRRIGNFLSCCMPRFVTMTIFYLLN